MRDEAHGSCGLATCSNFKTMESTKRSYHRRSDEERITDLEMRIAQLRAKQTVRDKKDDPVLREIPKLRGQLRKFAQLAMDHQRPDISNSTWAFTAGLDRILRSEMASASDRETPFIEDL